ncbi:bifunctional D-cysteine desulfhydrase/1-aminocyclopropane-1-carboxylate deaminase, mitochondrial [Lingula anatina]|uniref:Bifunctional D-cysteine desulfhydrase/1-aminocyclopropane-1-carboxylate deaminase, mitochondrial n=1 Tax=Lingula anatina TaxID=7574 RepID=A0A1S3JMM0_LINAN|nr:bifunctional D-cysteine desulfhydrase/1-aminocyclopropane-1-carboxylate deaminase, mitochondrial [Lingula anatina]|eukprot:XP_013411640.1 bifunctional D-cysteine desulfhydrase/1-aminocyclopropane-1-carboxylate deaminase, mitochondrial [Lingula anatina]
MCLDEDATFFIKNNTQKQEEMRRCGRSRDDVDKAWAGNRRPASFNNTASDSALCAPKRARQIYLSRAVAFVRKSSRLVQFILPTWAEKLSWFPQQKVKLAQLPTPIHQWNIPGIPSTFSLHIKRDDLTGSTLSGNKVRKLEFLLADALINNCKHVITCGGIQSNHVRATAVAAAQLGMQSHLLLRGDVKHEEDIGFDGNVLLNRLCGAEMYIVPRKSPYLTHLKPKMEKIANQIKDERGENSYLIPVGGSNVVGLFGYITAFQEMISQGIQRDFDDIVFACGSGGTAAGLALTNYLTGSRLRIHAVIVSDDPKYFHDHINETLEATGITDTKSCDIVDIIDGYKGKGYGLSTEEELEFILDVSTSTGIMLDPVYTGKAVRGLVRELTTQPGRFKGTRILFLHTGGVFGLFDGRMAGTLKVDKRTSKIKLWRS